MRPVRTLPGPPNRSLERDSSISSTITADSPFNKSLRDVTLCVPTQWEDVQEQTKHVQFDVRSNMVYEAHDKYEPESRWYTDTDYARFKKDTRATIVQTIEAEGEDVDDFDSFTNIMEEMYDECCEEQEHESPKEVLSLDQQERFAKMLKEPHNLIRIGLHNYTVELIKYGKDERRRTIVQVVKYLQEEYRSEERECVELAMSEVCEKLSRPARLFAQALAEAQHH